MATHRCPRCNTHHTPVAVGGKLVFGIASLLLGTTMKNPVAKLATTAVALGAGHAIDEAIDHYCPECGTVLRLLTAAM